MAEVTLPSDLRRHLEAMRQERDAVPPDTGSAERLPFTVFDLRNQIGRLCVWAEELGKAASEKNMPTDVTIVDSGIYSDGTYKGKIVNTGWKITVDTSIGGGGDLSYQYVENPPVVSSRGVLLTHGNSGQSSRLYAFKSVHEETMGFGNTLISTQLGISNHGDGFGRGHLAEITEETWPLPQFLDTWRDETGIITLRNHLVLFADRVDTYHP